MASSAGAVYVDVKANTQPFEQSMGGLGDMATKFGKVMAGAFSVAALANFAQQCIEVAAALTEVQNVVDQVFPTMGARADRWASSLIDSFGLSELAAKRYASNMAAMASSMGFTEEQAYEMGTSLAELSGDIASFYDMSADQAFEKLQSIFTGVTQPLRSLGINMTEATLDAYALANGFKKSYQEMGEAERTMLRYQFVLDRTRFAQGDFARTSDSWSNQMRILQMNVEALKASLGEAFVAALLPVLTSLNELIGTLIQATEAAKNLWGALANSWVGQAFGKLFGSTASLSDAMGKVAGKVAESRKGADAAASSAYGLADASSSAAKAAGAQDKATKKLNRTLAGFDRINKLAADSSSALGGSGGGGGGGGVSGGGIGDLASLFGSGQRQLGANLKRSNQRALQKNFEKGFKNPIWALSQALKTAKTRIAERFQEIFGGMPKTNLRNAMIASKNPTTAFMQRLRRSFDQQDAAGSPGKWLRKLAGLFVQFPKIGKGWLQTGASKNYIERKGRFGSELNILGENGSMRTLGGGSSLAMRIDGTDDVRQLADWWGGVTSKTAKLTAETVGKDKVEALKTPYDSIKSKTAELSAKIAAKAADVKSGWTSTVDANWKAKQAMLGYKFSGSESTWKKEWSTRVSNAFASKTGDNGRPIGYKWSSDLSTWKNNWNNRVSQAFAAKTGDNGRPIGYRFSNTVSEWRKSWTNRVTSAFPAKTGSENGRPIGFRFSDTAAKWKESWGTRVKAAFPNQTGSTLGRAVGFRFSDTAAAWKKDWSTRTDAAFPTKDAKVTYHYSNTKEAWKNQWQDRLSVFTDKTATVYLETKLKGVSKADIKNSTTGAVISGLEVAPSAWFAQGGYVERNTPRLAVIGDNRYEGEIVSPESKFQTMLDKAAGQGGGAETVRMLGLILAAVQSIDPNVYIDSRDVTRAVVTNINRQVQSTGRSPLLV